MRVDAFKRPTDHPADVRGRQALLDDGVVRADELVCVLGKTEGNGGRNDFTRDLAMRALDLASVLWRLAGPCRSRRARVPVRQERKFRDAGAGPFRRQRMRRRVDGPHGDIVGLTLLRKRMEGDGRGNRERGGEAHRLMHQDIVMRV